VEAAVNTENGNPKNLRKAAVVGAIAIALVATSSALAFANGAFGTPKVDRVGTFAAIEAGLMPTTTTVSPRSSTSLVRPAAGTSVLPAPTEAPEPTQGPTGGSEHTTAPVAVPDTTLARTGDSQPDSKPDVTEAAGGGPATTKPVSPVASGTVPRTTEVEREPPEIPETDD
jgi:hypothetical protein